MLKEMIEALTGLGRQTDRLEVVELERHRRTVVRHGSQIIDQLPWPSPIRASIIESLVDIATVIDSLGGDRPEIYVSEAGIEVFLDSRRLERFWMPFESAERFDALTQPRRGSPKAMVQSLRRALSGEPAIDRFIESIRHVDFSRTSTGKSHVEHGKESLGRSVEAEVMQAKDIPTEFAVETPVFANTGLLELSKAKVQMLVEIDPEEGAIGIFPAPDAVEAARRRALQQIADNIQKKFGSSMVLRGLSGINLEREAAL